MEVYILDSLYRRIAVVDRFESLIWTERWKDVGDFELVLPSTTTNRALFATDTPLGLNESRRVMLVETIEDAVADDGSLKLSIKGRSIEKLLDDRVARRGIDDTTILPKWTLTGTPSSVADQMFDWICRNGNIDPHDMIPLLVTGSAYPAESIALPATSITWEQEPDTLLKAIKDICDAYDVGFRLYRNGDTGQLMFNMYTGNDRTTKQTTLASVVFSPQLESVQNTKELTTVQGAKNVAYVISDEGFAFVYGTGYSSSSPPDGIARKVLLVKADKLDLKDASGNAVVPTAAQITAHLQQIGTEELAKNRPMRGFDGEINQHNPYKYGVHYELGDIIEQRNMDGMTNNMRVTEQIFASDDQGDRSYPTLTIQSFVTPGTWDSWLGNKMWTDMGVTDYWNTQP